MICLSDSSYVRASAAATLLRIVIFAGFLLLPPGSGLSCLQAGVTASQLVVVVNGDSVNSRTVANHYVSMRKIPAKNIIVLKNIPESESISIDQFRELILAPLLAEIDRRELAPHLQAIAYSADFPTVIDFTEELKNLLPQSPIYVTPKGSLTGMTYLYQLVRDKNILYASLESNFYARRERALFLRSPLASNDVDQWLKLLDLIESKKHTEAAEMLEEFMLSRPLQFPIAFMAAQQFTLAGDKERGMSTLQLAVEQGWDDRHAIETDPAFESLKQLDEFKTLIASMPINDADYQPSMGADSRAFWAPNGVATAKSNEGIRYLPAMMLAVTRGQGTSVQEAIDQLAHSAVVDYSYPKGGFYFSSTSDVRCTTRKPAFAGVIERLKTLGYDAEEVTSVLPMNKKDCLGVMLGSADFQWEKSESTLHPCAIAENLTSFGGVMTPGVGQTKLSQLIKQGAAASSGTVWEPYALQGKFPHPMIHVHYVRGSTLIESFFQSVTGPYQLLMVGDPLCQPFAKPPRFEIMGAVPHAKVGAVLPLMLRVIEGKNDSKPATMFWMVDGKLYQQGAFQDRATFETKGLAPGYHDITVVLQDDSLVGQRFEHSLLFRVAKGEKPITVKQVAPEQDADQGKATFSIASPGATQIELRHDWEVVGSSQVPLQEGETAEIAIPHTSLGAGPVRLFPYAMHDGTWIAGKPISVVIPAVEGKAVEK